MVGRNSFKLSTRGRKSTFISSKREHVRIAIKYKCVCLFRLNPLINCSHKNTDFVAIGPQTITVFSTDVQRVWPVNPPRDFVAVLFRWLSEANHDTNTLLAAGTDYFRHLHVLKL